MLLLANFSTWLRPNKALPIFMSSSLTAAQGPLPVVSKSGLHSRWWGFQKPSPWMNVIWLYLMFGSLTTQHISLHLCRPHNRFLLHRLSHINVASAVANLKRKKKGKGYEHSLNKYLCDYGLKKYKYNNVNKLVMVKMPVTIRSFSLVKLKKNGKENRKWLIYGIGEGVEKKAYSYLVDGSINSWITYVTIKN